MISNLLGGFYSSIYSAVIYLLYYIYLSREGYDMSNNPRLIQVRVLEFSLSDKKINLLIDCIASTSIFKRGEISSCMKINSAKLMTNN